MTLWAIVMFVSFEQLKHFFTYRTNPDISCDGISYDARVTWTHVGTWTHADKDHHIAGLKTEIRQDNDHNLSKDNDNKG